MAALKVRTFLPVKSSGDTNIDPVAGLTLSVNRLGMVVEDLGKILTSSLANQKETVADLSREQAFLRDKQRESLVESKTVQKGAEKADRERKGKKSSFLDGLLEPFKNLLLNAAIFGILKWIGDPKNEHFLRNTLPTLKTYLGKVWNIAIGSFNMIFDGLTENGPLMGALKIVGGIAGLFLVDRLLQPWKLLGDAARLARLFKRRPSEKKVREKLLREQQRQREAQRRAIRGNRDQRASRASKAARQRYQRRFGNDAARNRFKGRVAGRNSFRGTTFLGKAGRMLNSPGGAGVLSGVVSFGSRLAAGDSLQKAAGGGVGAAIGSVALTALLTPVLGPFAPLVGGTLGGFLGDKVGAFMGDAITPILKPLGNLFGEIILPIFKSAIKPLVDPLTELFQEFGTIFNMMKDFLQPLAESALQKAIEWLQGPQVKAALEGLVNLVKGAGQFIQGAAQGAVELAQRADIFGVYTSEVQKAELAKKDAAAEVAAAEENLAHYRDRLAKEGAGKRDHLFDNTLAEDVEAAEKRLRQAQANLEQRSANLTAIQQEAAQKQANLGDIQRQAANPNYQGNHTVTSEMGNRALALSPGMHMGVDIATSVGENLVAFTKGIVDAVGYDAGYGNWVSWIANDGFGNFYAHMDKPALVKAGQKVEKGQVLGYTGNTGRSSGPHLHWEVASNPKDTGRSKANVLSRVNPLSRYHKEHPFGGGPSLSPQLGSGGDRISPLNRDNRELNNRSQDEARASLVGSEGQTKVILQPIVKPVVQTVAAQPTFAPEATPTNIG